MFMIMYLVPILEYTRPLKMSNKDTGGKACLKRRRALV